MQHAKERRASVSQKIDLIVKISHNGHMSGSLINAERGTTLAKSAGVAPEALVVFQPQKLGEVVDLITLMGNISERIGEEQSNDMGGSGGSGQGDQGTQSKGVTARDEALKNLPTPEVMQHRLVDHVKKHMKDAEREARILSMSNKRGSAFALNEAYKKIRRLSRLVQELLVASAEVIQRFFIAIFIDNQSVDEHGSTQAG